MKNLNIKKISAYNFLAFGPDGVEINFQKLKNIVLIKGKNLDYLKDLKRFDKAKFRDSSNGSGKSSVQEIICYALYGKTIKNPKKISKDDVVNNFYKKNCKVEMFFDDYKILRTRSPDSLRLWKSEDGIWNKDTEITQGKQQDTQSKIDSIIGINYDVFISTSIFTDDQANCFLESDLSSKRSIIENLLSLDIYRSRFDYSKNLLKESKSRIKNYSSEYEILVDTKSNLDKRLASARSSEVGWKNSKEEELKKILKEIKIKISDLDSLNNDKHQKKYEQAQIKIKTINESIDLINLEIESLQNNLSELKKESKLKDSLLKETQSKFNEVSNSTNDKKNRLKQILDEISKLKKKNSEKKCGYCFSVIDPNNFIEIIKNLEDEQKVVKSELDELEANTKKINLLEIKNDCEDFYKNIKKIEDNISKKNEVYKNLRQEYKELSLIKEPTTNTEKSVLEKEIEVLKSKAKDLKEEYLNNSPYTQVIKDIELDILDAEKNINQKKSYIQEIEKDIPYLDFWVEAFGDSGIRKWVVDSIVPILNKKLTYLMSVLDNNRLNIEFDNELQEKIYKNIDGKEVVFKYHTLSAGQKRRLNLAVSQSFSHIMMNSIGSCPSLVFLDEVTTNIDPVGVLGIYNLICELSEDRQVFVTTHDPDLLEMLTGCDTLNFEMENGISTLKNILT
jgi:DNA repair exonuclease SbcCD ATPase subunit